MEITYSFISKICMFIFMALSRLTMVSREVKKKQPYTTNELSYLHVALL